MAHDRCRAGLQPARKTKSRYVIGVEHLTTTMRVNLAWPMTVDPSEQQARGCALMRTQRGRVELRGLHGGRRFNVVSQRLTTAASSGIDFASSTRPSIVRDRLEPGRVVKLTVA